jgi:predicted nucleotidyltransferase
MDKSSALETIDRFRVVLESKDVTVNKIILYGSFAREDYRDDSDIDVIVISDDFASLNYWERIDLLSEAIYEIFEPIEAVSFTSNEWESSNSFLVDYAKDGEVVYAA